MSDAPWYRGYVTDGTGRYLVQVPDATSRWGFYLADSDQSWAGGLGAWKDGRRRWSACLPADVPLHVRRDLEWILDGE